MAAMSAKGPPVTTSDDAEALACRKALENRCGFSGANH